MYKKQKNALTKYTPGEVQRHGDSAGRRIQWDLGFGEYIWKWDFQPNGRPGLQFCLLENFSQEKT